MRTTTLTTLFRRWGFRKENPPHDSVSVPSRQARRQRGLALGLGAAAAALAGYVATLGLGWDEHFHPDERLIGRWMDQVLTEGYITERAYPGGWFELYRIPAWLGEQRDKLVRHWDEHFEQDGRSGNFAQTPPPSEGRTTSANVQAGRNFNAWLFVLSCLFVYGACLEAGLHPVPAFVSSLFFVGSAPLVEFAHYCETDGGLVAAMAFCAWLATRTLRKGSAGMAVATGLATGFAMACKFTLFPLLLWCLLGPIAVIRRNGASGSRLWFRRAALASGCLVAAAAGYVAGTPALRLAPGWYLEAVRVAFQKTYAEILVNLGGHYTRSGAAVLRAGCLAREFRSWGWLPLGWGVFAWTFWFRKRFRGQLAGLPVLLPVFVPFLVFCCPFVRRQEMLPFAVLSAMGAGLPLEWLRETGWRHARRRWQTMAVAAAVALAGGGALAAGLARSWGLATCFAMRDTRSEAQDWLRDSVPSRVPIGFDVYVDQVARGVDCQAIFLMGLPYHWKGRPRASGTNAAPAYYLEHVGFEGRHPIRDPRTSRLLPQVKQRMAAYRASVLPLRTWAVSEAVLPPTFGQPKVRLVAFDLPAADACRVPIGYSRPVSLLAEGSHLYDAEGLPGLGAVHAVRTTGEGVAVHVTPDNGPRWLVTRMLQGSGSVQIVRDGLFAPAESELKPGGAVAAAFRPGWLERLAGRAAAHSTTRCRMKGAAAGTVCATHVASTAGEAARELRSGGNPDGALALLREAGTTDEESRVEAFLAAAAAGERPEAAWTESARAALAAWDRHEAEKDGPGRPGAVFLGVPAGILADFSRMRTGKQVMRPGLRLPAHLPPGRYAVSVFAWLPESGEGMPARLFDEQTEDFAPGEDPWGRRVYTAPLEVRRGCLLQVSGREGQELFAPFAAQVEISWSPEERTAETAEAIRRALETTSRKDIP